jgi:TRAP-type C4-dicarboxylate transport system permease small subunit
MAPIKLLAQVEHDLGKLSGPGIIPASPDEAVTKLESRVSQVIGILTAVAFIYFAIQVILAGYAYISSEGDKGKAETARKKLTDGILGLTILVVAVGLGSLLAKLLGLQNPFDLTAVMGTLKF